MKNINSEEESQFIQEHRKLAMNYHYRDLGERLNLMFSYIQDNHSLQPDKSSALLSLLSTRRTYNPEQEVLNSMDKMIAYLEKRELSLTPKLESSESQSISKSHKKKQKFL